jgi:hypothetical protein
MKSFYKIRNKHIFRIWQIHFHTYSKKNSIEYPIVEKMANIIITIPIHPNLNKFHQLCSAIMDNYTTITMGFEGMRK